MFPIKSVRPSNRNESRLSGLQFNSVGQVDAVLPKQ